MPGSETPYHANQLKPGRLRPGLLSLAAGRLTLLARPLTGDLAHALRGGPVEGGPASAD